MARRIGFGDQPPPRGGGWIGAALAVAAVILALAAVFDPDAFEALSAAVPPGAWEIGALTLVVVGLAVWILRGRRERRSAIDPPAEARRDAATPEQANDSVGETFKKEAKGPIGCFAIGFLFFWLTAWTIGIVTAIGFLLDEMRGDAVGPPVFLLVWIGFALVAWVVAAGFLIGMIRGLFARR